MPHDPRDTAARVLTWAMEAGASITSTDEGDGLHVAPEPPPVVDAVLQFSTVRLCLACWLEDAAERWPDAWAKGDAMVRTWLASRSCARIAFTGPQHDRHDTHRATRIRDGTADELADLLAIGDVMREDAITLVTPTPYDLAA